MKRMPKLSRLVFLAAVGAATYLGWVFAARALRSSQWTREHATQPPENPEFAHTYGGN